MEIEEQVVNPVEATATEEAVEQEVASPEEVSVEPEVVQSPVPDAGQKSVSDELDEFGVPYKNRAMEYKRKLEKLEKERQESQQNQIQQPQQRQYSIAELETFASETDNPAHKQWALAEAEKIREQKQAELVKRELEGWKKQTESEHIKQQTFNAVVSRNPDLIVKDANGNFLGWNAKNPLFSKINQYMSNPEIASHPRALEVAEAFAVRDLYQTSAPKMGQSLAKVNSELKSLQKKTLVEGGGNQVQQSVSPIVAAQQRLSETGSKDDAAKALKEIFKAKGVLKD